MRKNVSVVPNNSPYGIYVWMMDNGKPFSDDDGNVLNVPGRNFDIQLMSDITKAATYYGAPSGKPQFVPGVQRVSEMRHSEEVGRMAEGYIPSETDIGAWADAEAAMRQAAERGWDYDEQ
jgi:hypothetical protein